MEQPTETKRLNRRVLSELFDFLKFVVIAVIIIVPIRMFVAQPFIVSGHSMDTTFTNNEYLIVDEISYHIKNPARGEVVIFKWPKDHKKYFIKRIIALPGETITIIDNKVLIKNSANPDGFELKEDYISGMKTQNVTYTLTADQYFMMGDNRNESYDSRVWGAVNRNEIVGRAFLRLFPVNKISLFPGKYSFNL